MRNTILLEKDWTFYKNPQSESGEAVTLPHTWNAVDGQDGGNDYYRGTCKYVRHFVKPELEKGGRAYLEFDGAAMTADVVVNGTKLLHHEGGFSTFRVDVTEQLTEDNLLEVYVDNSNNTKVYPQKADFTFYGGLYRMVKLVTVPKVHFVMDYAGGNGMKVTPGGDDSGRCRETGGRRRDGGTVDDGGSTGRDGRRGGRDTDGSRGKRLCKSRVCT